MIPTRGIIGEVLGGLVASIGGLVVCDIFAKQIPALSQELFKDFSHFENRDINVKGHDNHCVLLFVSHFVHYNGGLVESK